MFLVSLNAVYPQNLGCCTNPGAGPLACTTDLAERNSCCPVPEQSNQDYYRSSQNPDGPADSSDCASNFFFQGRSCSDASVNACSLGCCCSELGGSVKPEAQCKVPGLTFHAGSLDGCNQVCQVPQCNDNLDNDNNGCKDFEGGDLGCTSPADTSESGGACDTQGIRCSEPGYTPKLKDLEVFPAKGQRKFLLNWRDECGQNINFYEVLRCKGGNCTNFERIAITSQVTFEDMSDSLLFDTPYTYRIIANYNLQIARPEIEKTASLGNAACIGVQAQNFCVNGTAYSCNALNQLSRTKVCTSSQVCVIDGSNQALCADRADCNYNSANPFGLYYTADGCEKGKEKPADTEKYRYCFYDRSHSIVNSCFSCDQSMACYDYKTESACSRDNCNIGGCKWKTLINQIGIGVCTSTKEYSCKWCDKKGTATLENARAYNEIFDICTREKSSYLSEGNFKCYFRDGISKNCDAVRCKDYEAGQCSNSAITHDENNKLNNPSVDECGIGVCQNINNACAKNADGDGKDDCESGEAACENDYYAPNTTLLKTLKNGMIESLIIQIQDRTALNSSYSLRSSQDYKTHLCSEPCGPNGHPYNVFTKSRRLIVSGLGIFDADNGSRLLLLKEGLNVIRYYSQDPSKNIEEVKKITIDAASNASAPLVNYFNVTNGNTVLGKLYTSSQSPVITIKFLEPAIVTFSRLVIGSTRIDLQGPAEPSQAVNLQVPGILPQGEYSFELNAKNSRNIFMEPPFSGAIVIDSLSPTLNITPASGAIINSSPVAFSLQFSEVVVLKTASINSQTNSQDVKGAFYTTDNKLFTATLNLSDGNKLFQAEARDFANNQVSSSASFIVDANPTVIRLASPMYGISSQYSFSVVVETDNNAACRHSFDSNFDFDFMDQFTSTGGTIHTIPNFNKIASGDNRTHKLYVKCRDQKYGITTRIFDISVDTTKPQIKSAFAFPNPVVESPSATILTIESDEPVICKFSRNSMEFGSMEEKFQDFDNEAFKVISSQNITLQNEGNFTYFIACKNKAGLHSDAAEIAVTVNLSSPLLILSHTPEFFNSTDAVLAIETKRKAQCKFSENDPTGQNGEIFGPGGYSHIRQLSLAPGNHTFYIICRDQYLQGFSDVFPVKFAIDVTPPAMLFVNDTSTLELLTEKTCLRDRLRVKWLGKDEESRVKEYFYSLMKGSEIIINFTRSFADNQWTWVENINLSDNTQYFFKVKSKNIVNLESEPLNSDGIAVDTSACQPKPICGDAVINPGEDCDGTNFGTLNCLNYTNFIGGSLRCTSDCKIDTSQCTSVPACGNSAIDPGESCDGTSFAEISACTDLGFTGGTLKCSSTCQLDTASCTERPKCGNGFIDAGESCDGTNLGLATNKCADYSPSTFTGGNLTCSACRLDTSGCQGLQGTCGDGTVNIGESCDGTSFAKIKNCTGYSNSFIGGTLKCSSTCQLDTASCTERPKCGNSAIDIGESCDGANIIPSSKKCVDYTSDFNAGDLSCTSVCRLDTSSCARTPTCGNGRLDTGELCDGTNFGDITNLSCSSYSSNFISGNLRCRSCRLSTENCRSNATELTCRDRGNCKINEFCIDSSDCESRFCLASKCSQPGCNDGIQNQAETGVDCGGICGKCQNGKSCRIDNDCQSNYCSFGTCKEQDVCFDSKLSPGESDVDCGGICSARCPENKRCEINEDCDAGLLCESSICRPTSLSEPSEPATDSDGDGLPDEWEIQNGLDPADPSDVGMDLDEDGLSNIEEFQLQAVYGQSTDPNNADTDNDGFSDKKEVDEGTSPIDAEEFPKSNFMKIMLFILGAAILISGFGYLAYRAVSSKRESFQLPGREPPRRPPMLPQQSQMPFKREAMARTPALGPRAEQNKKEMESLFSSFGKTEEKTKAEEKAEEKNKPESKAAAAKKRIGPKEKPLKKKPAKPRARKPKEDVFIKLKEISKESKKQRKSKNATK